MGEMYEMYDEYDDEDDIERDEDGVPLDILPTLDEDGDLDELAD